MSYFIEIPKYDTYSGQDEDLHFIYNANTGGGQSFLGGRFRDKDGKLVSPVALDGTFGVFSFRVSDGSGSIRQVRLADPSVTYEIKPRASGVTSMKFSVGNKPNPSQAIAAFLMMPETCGVNKSDSVKTSPLGLRNYWLQTMWLNAEQSEGETVLTPRDCVFCGGVNKDGLGKARYFAVDFSKRFSDVVALADSGALDADMAQCIGYFADLYKGLAQFDYKKATDNVSNLMELLIKKFPDRYSGLMDPLTFVIDSLPKKEVSVKKLEDIDAPLQMITYGAPGTGKSHGAEGLVKKYGIKDAFRTTFHPDSDYSTFVGAYKPTMKRPQRVVYVNDGKTAQLVDGPDELKYEEKISYEFRPQAFMNAYVAAWKDTSKPVVLVIEEINRGNCAQIFGDLFQLLDRDDATGYSTYPITADTDLAKWLASDEKDQTGKLLQFGSNGLADPGKPDCIKADDWTKVLKGEMLALPPNLYIWATMNTSDQSLFPMDSAFKRRWEWKYVPISKPDKDDDSEWRERAIKANNKYYDWYTFITIVNKHIAKTTQSEDKQLGYFFVKAPDDTGVISADRFVNKVLFFLFNDAFKDWKLPDGVFGKANNEKYAFKDFFYCAKEGTHKVGDIREDVLGEFLEHLQWENEKLASSTEAPKTNDENRQPGALPEQQANQGQPVENALPEEVAEHAEARQAAEPEQPAEPDHQA